MSAEAASPVRHLGGAALSDVKLHYDYQGKVELYNLSKNLSENNDLAHARPKLALDLLGELTGWLWTNCDAAYLPKPDERAVIPSTV